ncbi:hypothetical protein ATI45_1083 [Marinobacter sp. LV10MA510-1]|nr:hypothetical protein ATI45_1083 [Marinobacter sp. LV10MA510-1]PFG54648.1 hypothetical protein ATG98_3933 [Marinobacter sp. LV10R520-4]
MLVSKHPCRSSVPQPFFETIVERLDHFWRSANSLPLFNVSALKAPLISLSKRLIRRHTPSPRYSVSPDQSSCCVSPTNL